MELASIFSASRRFGVSEQIRTVEGCCFEAGEVGGPGTRAAPGTGVAGFLVPRTRLGAVEATGAFGLVQRPSRHFTFRPSRLSGSRRWRRPARGAAAERGAAGRVSGRPAAARGALHQRGVAAEGAAPVRTRAGEADRDGDAARADRLRERTQRRGALCSEVKRGGCAPALRLPRACRPGPSRLSGLSQAAQGACVPSPNDSGVGPLVPTNATALERASPFLRPEAIRLLAHVVIRPRRDSGRGRK